MLTMDTNQIKGWSNRLLSDLKTMLPAIFEDFKQHEGSTNELNHLVEQATQLVEKG
jgi:hypothetical protein